MNPVVTFLTTRNGYTFEEGVAVFAMYTKDRFAVERVRRSRDIRLLNQELKKLAHMPGLKPAPVTGYSNPSQPTPKGSDDRNRGSRPKAEPTPAAPRPEVPRPEAPESRVPRLEVPRHKYTRFEDMPTPETQALWQRNNQRWHEKVALFERMKLLPEGEELANVRNELVAISREHRECWQLIDRLCEEFHAQQKQHPAEAAKPAEAPQPFNVSTCRAYVSKALKKDTLSDAQFLELQRRVDAIVAANAEIKAETVAKLKALGIRV